MIERKIEIGGKPLKISDPRRKGVVAITTKKHLSDVFNDPRPSTNTSYVDYGETYAVMSFKYVYGSEEDLSLGAQILRKFDQWYYGVTSSNMIFWYRGLFPLLNKDPQLVQKLQNIVRVAAPSVFRLKRDDGGAKDFADAVFAKRDDNKIKNLILDAFTSQRTFENFKVNIVVEDLDTGTINVAFQFVAGEVPKFAGIKVFGSRELKAALKKDAMAFYRGFIAPHLSIFESRMRDTFLSGNFTVNQPQTLGQNPAFQAIFDQFGRTASQESSKGNSENTLRAKVIRLAHQNPELRKDLLPLLKQANPLSHWRYKKGTAYMKYRFESGNRLLVLISYRGHSDSVSISTLTTELSDFEKRAKDIGGKTLRSMMSQGRFGTQTFSMDSVHAEFSTKYPIFARHSSYYEVFEGKEDEVRALLENILGASEMK